MKILSVVPQLHVPIGSVAFLSQDCVVQWILGTHALYYSTADCMMKVPEQCIVQSKYPSALHPSLFILI